MREMNRIQPVGPPSAYKTFTIGAPTGHQQDFWRKATCAEVDCEHYLNGWVTICDNTPLGQQQAHYIRTNSNREYVEGSITSHVDDNGNTVREWSPLTRPDQPAAFKFPAGQPCFTAHKLRTNKPGIYLVRNGDWRQGAKINTSLIRQYDRDDQWVQDFGEHQQKLVDLQRRG